MSATTAERRVIMVARIEQKPTAKGKMMWRIIDEHDDFYSIFDEFVRSRIVEGQHNAVMVKVEERAGKGYKNIVGIAEGQVPGGGQVDMNELLPGAPAPSPNPQQTSPPAPAQSAPPPPITSRPQTPTGDISRAQMLDIRARGLELAVSLFNSNRISHDQIEPNATTFVGYILGEQQSSSGGSNDDQYLA